MLLERYVLFLEEKNGTGDVMAESRGKTEDRALGEAYSQFYNHGTDFLLTPRVQSRLTSSHIKIKSKKLGIAGLELADLLSLACKLDTLNKYGLLSSLKDNFLLGILKIIHPKYRRNPTGTRINGYGRKML